jgi:hypothetical protein
MAIDGRQLEKMFPPAAGEWLDAETQERLFDEWWPRLERRFFKLETLQEYDETGSPTYEAWRRGDLEEVRRLAQQQGEASAADPVRERAELVRVRILRLPVTPYVRFENEVYRHLVAAGSTIRGIEASKLPADVANSLMDFLLFDDRGVFVHDYRANGVRHGSWVIEDDAAVAEYARLADELLATSVPFSDLVTKHF